VNKMAEHGYTVLSALGPDRPGLVAEVTEFLVQHGCNVEESRMAVLGAEFGIMMLVRGPKDELDRLSASADELSQRTGLQFLFRATASPSSRLTKPVVPFSLTAHCLDHEGVVHSVAESLYQLGVNIASLETSTYSAPTTGTPLFRMHAILEVPTTLPVPKLRASLSEIAEQHNLDIELHHG
jgi:glycine cleavage system transcriptional repressor